MPVNILTTYKNLSHPVWTQTAIECLLRGAVCEGCYYNNRFEHTQKCHMKTVIIELTRILGKPKNFSSLIMNIKESEDATLY